MLLHLSDDLGVFFGEILLFGRVLAEVKQAYLKLIPVVQCHIPGGVVALEANQEFPWAFNAPGILQGGVRIS